MTVQVLADDGIPIVELPREAAGCPPCFHCGTRCPDRSIRLDDHCFCCNGCRMVYRLIRTGGLERFYDIEPAAGTRMANTAEAPAWTHLDDPATRRRLLDFSDGRLARATFRVPAMHCAACVWLLENLFRLNPAIGESRANFPRREVTLSFDESRASLASVVALLASLGYPPELNLDRLDAPARPAADPAARGLLLRIGVAGFAFGNIMLLSISSYFGLNPAADPALRQAFGALSVLLALPVLLYSASSYWSGAWRCLRSRMLTIDFPIAMGILALFVQSVVELATGASEGYLDSFAGLIFLLLCSQWLQRRTFASLSFERDYKAYFPLAAARREGNATRSVPVTSLAVGDRILVRNGELIPADALLRAGAACIDYSFVTGESAPQPRAVGDHLYAGGRQQGGLLELEIVKPVSQSYLTSLWNGAAFAKPRHAAIQNLTDRAGRRFTYALIAVAIATAAVWLAIDPAKAWRPFTSILLVACPCALALTAPFAFGSAQRILGRQRFFLRNCGVVEDLSRIDTVIFDKTGTLTRAAADAAPAAVATFNGPSLRDHERAWVAALADHSAHPASRRVAAACRSSATSPALVPENFQETPGLGIAGTVAGHALRLGAPAFVCLGADPAEPGPHLSIDGALRGRFNLAHPFRERMAALLNRLAARYRLALLSGDHPTEAPALCRLFGPNAELRFLQSPHAKLDFVKAQQAAEGRNVLMVGDGLNDAGALRQSQVGIAVTESAGLFSPASDAILEGACLPQLAAFLDFCRDTVTVVKIGFALALAYNIVGISIAAMGRLSPLVAAVLMPISSFSVIGFALGATRWAAWRRGLGSEPAAVATRHAAPQGLA